MTITDEEMERLRVSSVVAALTWRVDLTGLRVWNARDELEGTLVRGEMDGLLVWCPTEGDGHIHGVGPEWEIDLADSATRDRVVRWLGERHGLRGEVVAPTWVPLVRAWVLGGAVRFQPSRNGHIPIVVPSLSAVPDHDQRLPDGSPYASALALALVATHLGAQP